MVGGHVINPLECRDNVTSNNNYEVGTLAVDGWTVTFGTARRRLCTNKGLNVETNRIKYTSLSQTAAKQYWIATPGECTWTSKCRRVLSCIALQLVLLSLLPPTMINVLPVFVCLSVCLLARLLKNACMDLNEMLRVDSWRDMDEPNNFSARSGL